MEIKNCEIKKTNSELNKIVVDNIKNLKSFQADTLILSCFSRSFDEVHVKSNKIHLVSSSLSINLDEKINLKLIFERIINYTPDKKEYIFIVINGNEQMINKYKLSLKQIFSEIKFNKIEEETEIEVVEDSKLIVSMISLDELVVNFKYNNKNNIVFKNLTGGYNISVRDSEALYSKSLFIFVDLFWSDILLKSKLNDIEISGGSISKRHILSTVNIQLMKYLSNLFNNDDLKKISFDSYKNPILSSQISKKIYEYHIDKLKELKDLKIKDLNLDVKDTSDLLNSNTTSNENNNSEMSSIVNNSSNNSQIDPIISYYIISFDVLVKSIIFTSLKLFNLKKNKIEKFKSEIEKNNIILDKLEYSRVYLSDDLISFIKTKYKVDIELRGPIFSSDLLGLSLKVNMRNSLLREVVSELESEYPLLGEENLIQNLTNKNLIELNNQFENLNSTYEREYNKFLKEVKEEILDIDSYGKAKNLKKKRLGDLQKSNFYHGTINEINGHNSGIRKIHTYTSKRFYSSKHSRAKLDFYIDSPIYIELKRILSNSTLDIDTQIKIEQFLINQGSILLKSKIDKTLDINYYKLNPQILELLKKSIDELDKLISNYKYSIKEKKIKSNTEIVESFIILGLSNEDIISQLLGRFLRIISNNNIFNKNTNCTELACDLGQSLLYLYYSIEYKQKIGISHSEIEGGLSKFIQDNFISLRNISSDTILIQIGLRLLNFLEEVKLIKSKLYIVDIDHKNHIFVCEDEILNSLGNFINYLNFPYKLPMIVKPKKYSRDLQTGKEILGGFMLNDKEQVQPIIIKNNELKDQSLIKDDNIIYELVNNLSSVAFKINTAVLEFILDKGLEFDLFTDPNFKHPLEIKKDKLSKLTLIEKKTLESFLSRKQLENNILALALLFKDVPEFFIPVRIDNRGRVYCMVDYLNYQGIELAKSLLLFSKGEKIIKSDTQSIEYLKIFGANCYGNGIDKKSYRDRVDWVNNNIENILNFKNGILIREAESKLLFISFCFEYTNYYNSLINNETYYISHFPIQLDATCNGYQHLSLLTGDEPLAGQLNLISGDESSVPNDFYSFVALKLNDYFHRKMTSDFKKYNYYLDHNLDLDNLEVKTLLEDIESCGRLIKLNKNRRLVKLPIMVKPYNASLYQMTNYVKEQFDCVAVSSLKSEELDYLKNNLNIKVSNKDTKVLFVDRLDKDIKLITKDLFILSKTIEQIIYNEFPKLKEFNAYLNRVAEICSTLNITITWVLPSGLSVNQYYVDSEAIRLKPFKFKKNTFTLKIKNNKINKNKQIRALMPNLIHSLDSASLSLIVELFFQANPNNEKRINFFAIHDCFAVTANNVVNLIKLIKLVYIKIYSDDSYLRKFDQGIINSIKLQFGVDCFNDQSKIIKINGLEIQYPDVDNIIKGKIEAEKIMKAYSIIN